MTIPQSPSIWRVALLLAISVSILYLAFPSHFYNGDALQVMLEVERDVKLTAFYHPSGSVLYEPDYLDNPVKPGQAINIRYFLDYPTLNLVSHMWIALGLPSETLIMPVLIYRAVMGGVSVFFTALFMFRLRPVRWIAMVVALGVGLSATHWTYATDLYQSITLVALVAAAAYGLAVQARKPVPQEPIGLILIGFILALATLHNILGVFAVAAFGLAILALPTEGSWILRLRAGLIFGLAVIITAGVVYAGVQAVLPVTQGQSNPFQWSDDSGDTQDSVLVDFSPLEDGLRAFLGIAKSQIIFPGINVRHPQGLREYWDASPNSARLVLMGFYSAFMLVMILPIGILFIRRKLLPPRYRWLYVLLAGLVIFYTLFNWYWLPSDVHYWLVPTLCLWIILGFALAHLQETSPRLKRVLLPLSVSFVAFMVAFNWFNQILPQATNPNLLLTEAEELRAMSTSKDLFLSDGNPVDFYIVYFARRNLLAVSIISMQADANAARITELATEQGRRVLADGGNIYFYTRAKDPSVWQGLATLVGLPPETPFELVAETDQHTIYRFTAQS
jgi:hypothetical protein